MKKNNYLIVLICTLVFVVVEFSALQITLKTTRLFPKTEIILKIEDDSIDDYELPLKFSEESIQELKKVLSETSINNNQDKLVASFDKERTFYINFITIISIVLSIFGIAPAIYGIFEKNENVKLREELETLKDEYGLRLDKIKQKNVFDWFIDKTNALKSDYNFIFDDSTSVNDENDFYKFILYFFIKTIKEINIDLLNESNIQTFAIELSNFMHSIILYSTKRYDCKFEQIPNTEAYSIKNNEIFYNMFINLQSVLPEEKFKNLLDVMKSLPNTKIDYSDY